MNLKHIDAKVRRVKDSARTPEQKETSARYMELYRAWLDYEQTDVPKTKFTFFAALLWPMACVALILIINFLIEVL